jgi:hypothetical protein
MEKTKAPIGGNQKSAYQRAFMVFEGLLNGSIEVSKAEQMNNALGNINRAFSLEIKLSELTKKPMRIIENFDFTENIK